MAINLNKREKIAVAAAIAAIALFVVLQLLIFPLFERNDRLSQALASRQEDLQKIRMLQTE